MTYDDTNPVTQGDVTQGDGVKCYFNKGGRVGALRDENFLKNFFWQNVLTKLQVHNIILMKQVGSVPAPKSGSE